MNQLLCVVICLISASSALCVPITGAEDRALLDQIIAYDRKTNGGKAWQDKDSGALAWNESYILTTFYQMYQVTGDTHWLDRLTSHADVILGNASKDQRGHTGWFTATYSYALAEVSAQSGNRGDAELTPAKLVLSDTKRTGKVPGHSYSITAREDGSLDVRDETAGSSVGVIPKGQSEIAVSEFAFTLKGTPKAGDRFIVKTTAPEPTDYVVHDGMILQPIASFVETVLSDPGLKAKYGDKAKHYLQFIEKSIVPKWDDRWRDFGGGAGAYLSTNLKTHRFPDVTLPHNQYLALGRVFFPLYRVTGKKVYLARATAMAKFFKSKLTLVDGGYVWNYWDPARPEDEAGKAMSQCEDTSHASIDIAFAVDAYEMGVVFTREDIDRFALTYARRVWNQSTDKPLYCSLVDRRLDPKGTDDKIAVYGWQMLARYCPEVVKAVEPAYKHGYSWQACAAEWLYARYTKHSTK